MTAHAHKISTIAACKDKGYSTERLRRMIARGALNGVKIGARWWVCLDEKYEALPRTELGELRNQAKKTGIEMKVLRLQVAQLERLLAKAEMKLEGRNR